ncbi:MAG TPA: hypothetical protein VKR06_22460, partial [Ktedonosporobacter sp.]|nr:hypothetical protein [Ktedonosporobacter sp.]
SPSKTFLPSFKRDTIGKMKDMMGEAQQKRTLIYKLLEKGKIYSGEHGSLDRMAAQREHLYADAPLQV